MGIALDYTSRIDPAALKAVGVTDVCRYLSWTNFWAGATHSYPNPKVIQQREYDELLAAGIGVTLNWEYDAHDWLSGAGGGRAHAIEAARQARALGYPAGCTIIGSADFDMTRSEWTDTGRGYADAFVSGIRGAGYIPGVYGPSDVLGWCSAETGMRAFWQAGMSWAWSGGRNRSRWPGAHLRQMNHKTVGGQDTDWNEILISDWGQARKDVSAPMSEQLLNAWPVPAELDGKTDSRGAGIWLADLQHYVWHGVGAYGKATDVQDPITGPSNGTYLDTLLKLIRDEQRGSHQAIAGGLAELTAQRLPAAMTDAQVKTFSDAVVAALPAAMEAALKAVTLRVE